MAFPKNVFVLNTGRCGSTTLYQACSHFDNYTAEHEGLTHQVGPARFDFPTHHIEIDNRLSWVLGRLERAYGNDAAYVHLTRDSEAVAASYAKRSQQGILKSYRDSILMKSKHKSKHIPLLDFCHDYIDTVTANIEFYLRDKTHVIDFKLENAAVDFDRFIDWIGATGDLTSARAEFDVLHNASKT
ncbi:hypothetical protein [Aestuariibius sp. HNIBRBA575]|uniref:hypothetical protein n=1 Tax=Aestuariibius sp. HNIBRBA575 TaxID=3233343 RepID=UPI0034A127BA